MPTHRLIFLFVAAVCLIAIANAISCARHHEPDGTASETQSMMAF